jgi:hypothetical protein
MIYIISDLERAVFHIFSELKNWVCVKFKVLFLNLRKFRKYNFPRKTRDLAKMVLNFTDTENLFLKVPFQKLVVS